MASTEFVNFTGPPIDASWLNDVNATVYGPVAPAGTWRELLEGATGSVNIGHAGTTVGAKLDALTAAVAGGGGGGGGGTVTGVTATLPVVSTGGTAPVISLNVVTTSTDGAMLAADKVKLNSVAESANNYTHPVSHLPSIITQDANNRFVTDAEKATWNSKQAAGTYATGTGSATGTNTGDQTSVTGNAGTATKLATPRLINGVAFDGSADITIGGGGGGTVTSVTASLPLVSSGGTAPVISLNQVTTTTDGSMIAADKIKLNGIAAGATANTGDVTLTGAQTLTNKTLNLANNTVTVDGTEAVGYRGIPQNSQSAAYTLVLADAGKHLLHPSSDTTARIFTIPANASVAFPIGTAVTFINQNAAGVATISITTDTMRLAGAGTTGSRTLAENGMATAVKITATEWLINGVNLT